MDFYDILQEGCKESKNLAEFLGYKRLLVSGEDFKLLELDKKTGSGDAKVIVGSDTKKLAKIAKYNKFIVPRTFSINKFMISKIKENDAILCLPLDSITTTHSFIRARNIRMMRNLFSYAKSKRIRIAIASFAPSPRFMNSREQLLELAKLITKNEQLAMQSIETNRLVIEDGV